MLESQMGEGVTSVEWGWSERNVNPAKDHFELRYGPADDPDSWVMVARVGRPIKRNFGVQFVIDRATSASAAMVDAAIAELSFYLVKKREQNPWAYAQYHCGTSANLYSSIHWLFRAGKRKATC